MSKTAISAVTRNKKEVNGSPYGLRRKAAVNKTKKNESKSKLTVPKTKTGVGVTETTSKSVAHRSSGINNNNLMTGSPNRKLAVSLADSKSKLKASNTKKAADRVPETSSKPVTRRCNGIIKNNRIKDSPTNKLTELSADSISKLKVLNTKKTAERVPETISKPVTRRSNGIIKNKLLEASPTKKLTIVSTKLRPQKTKPWTDVSTTKTKQLDQKTPTVKNSKKRNESAIETKTVSITKKTESKSPVENINPQISKIPLNNVSVQIERLSKRVETIYKGRNKNKLQDKEIKVINSTPQNKNLSFKNKSGKPTRVLRKRNNVIPNKYKDCSLSSPFLIKRMKKSVAPNPLAVYEFEFDPSEEPAKKQNRKKKSESSDEEDDEMKYILKKFRKANKKVAVGPKKMNKDQKKVKLQKNIEQVNEEPNKVSNSETKQNGVEEKQIIPDKQKLPEQNQNTLQPEIINELQISDNNFEIDSISDHSGPLDSVSVCNPSIQARNIVEEVTKSFIEDLSDEESNNLSPGKFKIVSNIVVRKSKTYKNKVFNSTTNGMKPSKPWRIDVSAIRRRPHIFTYKDKSFTPRYDPEIITSHCYTHSNITEKDNDKTQENSKPSFQTSILDFVKGSKPKIIENKISGLFNDLPRKPLQSPRKVLGEINFVQSTPLKPNYNLNILKSPNVSFIKPKNKSSDGMFGFSYFSEEDENKENVRKSPRKSPKKLKPKPANISENEIVKQNLKEIDTNKENDNKVVKEENLTLFEPEISALPIDSDISFRLFQDIDNETDVLKKSTRKYVRKHPKRKRLPSVDTVPSDNESEPEKPERKKQKYVRTKKEEEEADRLAAHYNSMFEEMEKYPLIIE